MAWASKPKTASHISVFKHTRRWVHAGVVQDAYTSVLQQHARAHPPSHYIVDSSYVKNAVGRDGLGRNPVDRGRNPVDRGRNPLDRGRKVIKVSAHTDQDGIVHNIRSDGIGMSFA